VNVEWLDGESVQQKVPCDDHLDYTDSDFLWGNRTINLSVLPPCKLPIESAHDATHPARPARQDDSAVRDHVAGLVRPWPASWSIPASLAGRPSAGQNAADSAAMAGAHRLLRGDSDATGQKRSDHVW